MIRAADAKKEHRERMLAIRRKVMEDANKMREDARRARQTAAREAGEEDVALSVVDDDGVSQAASSRPASSVGSRADSVMPAGSTRRRSANVAFNINLHDDDDDGEERDHSQDLRAFSETSQTMRRPDTGAAGGSKGKPAGPVAPR